MMTTSSWIDVSRWEVRGVSAPTLRHPSRATSKCSLMMPEEFQFSCSWPPNLMGSVRRASREFHEAAQRLSILNSTVDHPRLLMAPSQIGGARKLTLDGRALSVGMLD